MRHRLKGRHLGRNPSHRRALRRNLALSLLLRYEGVSFGCPVESGRIRTTIQKAKEVKSFIERLVSLAVRTRRHFVTSERLSMSHTSGVIDGSGLKASEGGDAWHIARAAWLSGCRRLYDLLRNWNAVRVLVGHIAIAFENRKGGYLRVVRIAGYRLGDAAKMAYLEFVGSKHELSVAS